MVWNERITVNPKVLGGRPAVKGTRLSVSLILELMAAGASEKDILTSYPQLAKDDVRACLRYASESLEPPITTEIDAWIENPNIPLPAQALLSKADAKFRACELGAGSDLVWQAVEWSIREVAAQRGWPAGDIDELEQAIERLGNEKDDDESLNLMGGFLNALAIRENVDGKWLCGSEIAFYANLMPPFIERIFVAAARHPQSV